MSILIHKCPDLFNNALKATEILVFQQWYRGIGCQCVIRYLALRGMIKYLVADCEVTPLLLYHERPSVDGPQYSLL